MKLRALVGWLVLLTVAPTAPAYVEAPMSLGAIIQQSTVVCSMVVTKVDKQNNLIVFQKVADLKGKHPQDTIKHNIGRGGLRPGEWQEIMAWAEVGKPAVFFHNGGASETYIGTTWYQAYPNGEWWGMSHAEPFLLRSYAGKVDKLPQVVAEIVAGKEVVVPCMVDGDKEALHKKTARIQRLRASLKLQDYNPKRDFAGWGGEEIRRLAGMPGFDRFAALGSAGADTQAATAVDFDADGKPDVCLVGANRVLLLQNGGDAFSEVTLPGLVGGARSAVWADHNGDGLPDVLLATATGPKLYTNLGPGRFRDDTRLLPRETPFTCTAAAWGDFDGDGKPDILLATAFHGLKLYRNNRPGDAVARTTPPKLGPWHAVGPFRHKEGPQRNFEFAFAPETEKGSAVDLKKLHRGKREMECRWQTLDAADGAVVSLNQFGLNCATYLYREITVPTATELPVSLGSDDTLTVWLNGEKLHSENVTRAAAPDQVRLTLKLKPGTNHLLLKVCNTDGEYGFYFAVGEAGFGGSGWFQDVSSAWGLGPTGDLKGDSLSVADLDNDGKPDVLFGAGTGVVLRNAGGRFEVKDVGISYRPGKVGPALGDYDGDGAVDLFVPQADGKSKLYRNDGGGRLLDVTGKSGDLAKLAGQAVGAAWGDFDNDGKPDLLVCLLRGPNRYYRNNGDGTFTDKSSDAGLSQKVFNTQAAAWADLNADGRLDLILANEGQDSAVLFGGPADAARWTPVTVRLPAGAVGGRVTVTAAGKAVASAQVLGGDGRGGQAGLVPRFALPPGEYTLTVRSSDGNVREKPLTVAKDPVSVRLE